MNKLVFSFFILNFSWGTARGPLKYVTVYTGVSTKEYGSLEGQLKLDNSVEMYIKPKKNLLLPIPK